MGAGTRRVIREAALTIAAVLGVLCVALAIATPLLGMKLLVFKSGSMGPDIETGAVAVTRTVDDADLSIGDVVSVTSSDGTRITHRITGITPDGDQTLLELTGDANASADAERYAVTEADLVVAHVNKLGYVVDALASPYAVFLAGAAATGLVVLTFRRRSADPGDAAASEPDFEDDPTATEAAELEGPTVSRRRLGFVSSGIAVAILAVGATCGAADGSTLVPTMAAFSDAADVTASVAALEVPSPVGTIACANGPIFSGIVTLSWQSTVEPPVGYHYQAVVYQTDPSNPVATYTTTTPSVEVRRADLAEADYRVQISGALENSSWQSSGTISAEVHAGWLGYEINCK